MPRHRSHFRGAVRGPAARPGALDARLLLVIDLALAGCVFLVPLLMGGRQALGQFVLVVLAVVAAVAWAVRQGLRTEGSWRPAPVLWVFAAAILLLLVQLAPLGSAAVAKLSPYVLQTLPLWDPDGDPTARLGAWACLSLTPSDTLNGLAVFLAYALVFFVTVQRIRAIQDVERLLRWCGIAALGMAAFGLLQLATTNGKFFWFYEHPYGDTFRVATGSFTNRNHFAQFLALGIGPLIWWMQSEQYRASRRREHGAATSADERQRRLRLGLLMVCVGLVLLAGLLSVSVGGNIAIFVAATIITAVCYRAASVGGRFIAGLAAAVVAAVALMALEGSEQVGKRFDKVTSGSLDKADPGAGRRNIWVAVVRAIPHFAALGSGVGSHREVYPMFFDTPLQGYTEFTHAENSYLQVGLETGAAGLFLSAIAIGLCAKWCLGGLRHAESRRAFVAIGAISASLAANLVHAVVDFVWYVPGCMVVVAILAAAAMRCRQLARDPAVQQSHSRPLPRLAAWAAAALLLVAGGWIVWGCAGPVLAEPAWHRHLFARQLADSAAPKPPPDPDDLVFQTEEDIRKAKEAALKAAINTARQRIADLEEVLRWQPGHARAHVALAEAQLRFFDLNQLAGQNQMSLSDVRDAVMRSRFSSREAVEAWLNRAVGEHWTCLKEATEHVRRGLSLCPLQGKGYLFLAELCFLDGADETVKNAHLDQALRVRPYDGDVLFAAAQQALRAGKSEAWLDYLHRSFNAGAAHQQRIAREMISHTPPEGLGAMIDFLMQEFQPDLDCLREMHFAAMEFEAPERFAMLLREQQPAAIQKIRVQLAPFRQYFGQWAESDAPTKDGADAAQLWLDAHRCYSNLNNGPKAVHCARQAVKCDPCNFDAHYQLAASLIDEQEFAEAETQLHWCLQRKPDQCKLQWRLKDAMRGRMDQQSGVMSDRLFLRF